MLRRDLLVGVDVMFTTFGCVLFLRLPFAMSNATVFFLSPPVRWYHCVFVDRMNDKKFDGGMDYVQ